MQRVGTTLTVRVRHTEVLVDIYGIAVLFFLSTPSALSKLLFVRKGRPQKVSRKQIPRVRRYLVRI